MARYLRRPVEVAISSKRICTTLYDDGQQRQELFAGGKSAATLMRMALTAKQRAFVSWYCSAEVNMNGTEAARRAGYKGSNPTLRAVAHENLTKPHIQKEIQSRTRVALSNTNVTVEKVLRDLELTYVEAMNAGCYSPAVRCLELQGKYLKMFSDKIEHVRTLEETSLEELVELMYEIAQSGNIDLRQLLDEAERTVEQRT